MTETRDRILKEMQRYNSFLPNIKDEARYSHVRGIVKGLHVALDIVREVEHEHSQE